MKHTRYNGGIIRPRGSRWLAELSRNYKTLRKSFPTPEACKDWIDEEQLKRARQVRELKPRELIDANDALRLLPTGTTMTETVKYWLAHHQENQLAKVPVKELYQKYLADKTAAGLRPRSLAGIRTFVGRLERGYSGKQISTITSSVLSDYMISHPCSPSTRNSLRRYWWGFFDYCRRIGAIDNNPAEAITPGRADEKMPQIFTVEETERILQSTMDLKSSLLPLITFGLFTGLRTSELLEIKWSDVSTDHIRVIPSVAKKRRQRIITIPDNLKPYITGWKLDDEKISPIKERRLYHYLREIAKKSNLPTWTRNGMRHSFASYHLALYRDAAKTATILGHTQNVSVLWNHYRELVTEADAKRYFDLKLPPADKESGAQKVG
jgi:integrase